MNNININASQPVKLTVLSFDDWVKEHPEVVEEIKKEAQQTQGSVCDYCGGSTYHECECGSIHRCHHCEGKGKVIKSQLEIDRDVAAWLKKLYESQLTKDLTDIDRWRRQTNTALSGETYAS